MRLQWKILPVGWKKSIDLNLSSEAFLNIRLKWPNQSLTHTFIGYLFWAKVVFANTSKPPLTGRTCDPINADSVRHTVHIKRPADRWAHVAPAHASDYQGALRYAINHPGGMSSGTGQIMDRGPDTHALSSTYPYKRWSIPRLMPQEMWEAVQFITTARSWSSCVHGETRREGTDPQH